MTLIHNPAAGWGDLSQRQLTLSLERGGYEVRTAHLDNGLGKNLAKRTDVVIAAGGDGTVAAVASRLVHTKVPLIILPLGTANNVARTVGMQPTIECALETLENHVERSFDMGVASGSWGERYFSESAGVGWFCDALTDELTHEDKAQSTALEVLTDFLERYEAKQWVVTLDGVDCSGEYLLIEAMNARMLGPNVELTARADPFDGALDVVLATEKDRTKLLTYLDGLRQGHDVKPPRVPTRQAKHVHFSLGEKNVRIDDAVRPKAGAQRSHFADLHVLPGAVRMWTPRPTASRSRPTRGSR